MIIYLIISVFINKEKKSLILLIISLLIFILVFPIQITSFVLHSMYNLFFGTKKKLKIQKA